MQGENEEKSEETREEGVKEPLGEHLQQRQKCESSVGKDECPLTVP